MKKSILILALCFVLMFAVAAVSAQEPAPAEEPVAEEPVADEAVEETAEEETAEEAKESAPEEEEIIETTHYRFH